MLTVHVCEPIEPSGNWRVVLTDDTLPSVEGELVLRPGIDREGAESFEMTSLSLRVSPDLPEGRLNSTRLKEVALGRWLAVAIAATADRKAGRDLAVWTATNMNPYRKRVPSSRLNAESVAMIYRLALREGRHSPAQAIAGHFEISIHRANQWIARARLKGALGPIAPREPRPNEEGSRPRRVTPTLRRASK